MFDDFLALSRILTGVQNLDAELGRQYLDRLTSTPFEPVLHQILERFRELKDGDTRVDRTVDSPARRRYRRRLALAHLFDRQ